MTPHRPPLATRNSEEFRFENGFFLKNTLYVYASDAHECVDRRPTYAYASDAHECLDRRPEYVYGSDPFFTAHPTFYSLVLPVVRSLEENKNKIYFIYHFLYNKFYGFF